MAITLETNYKEIFSEDTVTIIESLKESYELNDILEVLDVLGDDWTETQLEDILNTEDKDALYDFLEAYGHSSLEYYEKFVDLCFDYDEDAVSAYIECVGIDRIYEFEEAYEGHYGSIRDFVEEQLEVMEAEIPSWLSIDYETTWNSNLRHDYLEENGYYFRLM
jgi:hypothetical protein